MRITKEELKQIIIEELESGLMEQEDANKEIDKAQIEAQKIAQKLVSELQKVSETSGLDVGILASLVKQFVDEEMG